MSGSIEFGVYGAGFRGSASSVGYKFYNGDGLLKCVNYGDLPLFAYESNIMWFYNATQSYRFGIRASEDKIEFINHDRKTMISIDYAGSLRTRLPVLESAISW